MQPEGWCLRVAGFALTLLLLPQLSSVPLGTARFGRRVSLGEACSLFLQASLGFVRTPTLSAPSLLSLSLCVSGSTLGCFPALSIGSHVAWLPQAVLIS